MRQADQPAPDANIAPQIRRDGVSATAQDIPSAGNECRCQQSDSDIAGRQTRAKFHIFRLYRGKENKGYEYTMKRQWQVVPQDSLFIPF